MVKISLFEYEVQWTDSDGKLRVKWYVRQYNAENKQRTLAKQKIQATIKKSTGMDPYEASLKEKK